MTAAYLSIPFRLPSSNPPGTSAVLVFFFARPKTPHCLATVLNCDFRSVCRFVGAPAGSTFEHEIEFERRFYWE